jgi:hypothetical protein
MVITIAKMIKPMISPTLTLVVTAAYPKVRVDPKEIVAELLLYSLK